MVRARSCGSKRPRRARVGARARRDIRSAGPCARRRSRASSRGWARRALPRWRGSASQRSPPMGGRSSSAPRWASARRPHRRGRRPGARLPADSPSGAAARCVRRDLRSVAADRAAARQALRGEVSEHVTVKSEGRLSASNRARMRDEIRSARRRLAAESQEAARQPSTKRSKWASACSSTNGSWNARTGDCVPPSSESPSSAARGPFARASKSLDPLACATC